MQHRIIGYLDERTRFLAAVTHDLRSPITRLRLRTELLPLEELKIGFRKDLTEMESMVDATLSFVKDGIGEELQDMIDLDDILAAIFADLNTQGIAATLTGSVGAPIRGFPQGLRRCIWNLVDNAARYGGRADIKLIDHESRVTVSIRDEGRGIAPEKIDMVFELFYREQGCRNIALGDVGLGLSIAKGIATAHGGTLNLRNLEGRGLEAILYLPR